MGMKEGSGESACTPLSFRPCNVDYIQLVDVVFLALIRMIAVVGQVDSPSIRTECPNACSHSLIPNRLGTPLTVELPLGVAESWAVADAAGFFGRAVRLRVSRSLRAFLVFVRSNTEWVDYSTS